MCAVQNTRCWIAIAFFVPSVVAVVLLMSLPWGNRVGLLCAYYLMCFGGAPSWAMIVGWVAVTSSGHTKVNPFQPCLESNIEYEKVLIYY